MRQLSLEQINAKAPYHVVLHEQTGSYRFKSETGVRFAVSFDVSWIINSITTYEITIANLDNKPSPRDSKTRDTVSVIVEEFFRENQTGMLYICETGDNKQAMRNRLFVSWIALFNELGVYEVRTATLHDADGVENYAAMIVRKDNPLCQDYLQAFEAEAEFFNSKPGVGIDSESLR